jgi:hypothetical protein
VRTRPAALAGRAALGVLAGIASMAPLAGMTVMALLVSILWPASPADAGLADRIGATFSLMSQEFVAAFRPVEALVVAVEGDAVYIDLGASDGVQVGQEFTIFRKGEVFQHPLTGKPMGRHEEMLGYAQARRVQPQFTEAAFIPRTPEARPKPEDGVRISRGRIKVAVAPLLDLTGSNADLRRVPFLLSIALDRSRRFQVADPIAVTDLFANGTVRVEEILARPAVAIRHGKSLDVTAWLVPILMSRGGVTYLDATWISAATGTALFSRRQALTPPDAVEEQRFPWEPPVRD